MPDLGGVRRGIGERTKQATQHVSRSGHNHFESLSAGIAGSAPPGNVEQPEEQASAADVTEEANRLQAIIKRRRPPPGPVQGRWAIGVGDLLAEHPRMPNALRGLARNLDRYGGLAIIPRTIEFDHDAIEWASVTEIRTRSWSTTCSLERWISSSIRSAPLVSRPPQGIGCRFEGDADAAAGCRQAAARTAR